MLSHENGLIFLTVLPRRRTTTSLYAQVAFGLCGLPRRELRPAPGPPTIRCLECTPVPGSDQPPQKIGVTCRKVLAAEPRISVRSARSNG